MARIDESEKVLYVMLPKYHDMDGFLAITVLSPQRPWSLLRPPPAMLISRPVRFRWPVHRKTTLRGAITLSILIPCQGSINNVAFAGAENRFAALTFHLG